MNGAIVFAITGNYLFSVANVILGIEKNSPSFCDQYIIFTNDKSDFDPIELESLYKCAPKKKINILEIRSLLPNFEVTSNNFKAFIKRYSIMPFVKLYLPLIFAREDFGQLSRLDFLLWLDSDTLVLKDISPILNHGLVCACSGTRVFPRLARSHNFPFIEPEDIKPNGGVVLYKRDILDTFSRYQISYFGLINDIVSRLFDLNEMLIDELALLIAFKSLPSAECHLDIISNRYNFDPRFHLNIDPVIVHSAGYKAKFWDNYLVNRLYPQWEENNLRWLQTLLECGLPAKDLPSKNKSIYKVDLTKNILKEYENRKFWAFALSQLQFCHSSIWMAPDIYKDSIRFNLQTCDKGAYYALSKASNSTICIELVVKHSHNEVHLNTLNDMTSKNNYKLTLSEENEIHIYTENYQISEIKNAFNKFINNTLTFVTD